jgi:hypothetical protein
LFTHEWPGTEFVIGAAIAVIGSFILFTEKRGILEIVRAVPAREDRAKVEVPHA